LLAGKYETAAGRCFDSASRRCGDGFYPPMLASALGHLGEIDEARRVWEELEKINPKYSSGNHFARQAYPSGDVERIADRPPQGRLPV